MVYLSIDLGDKRTGLAVGDDELRLVTPLDVLESPMTEGERGDALVNAVADAATEYGADALVVGLPFNMDGAEGPRAKAVRSFAARIAARTSLPLHFADERLTSADADWAMSQTGLTHKQKKARRDALAAAAILRGYLDSLPRH